MNKKFRGLHFNGKVILPFAPYGSDVLGVRVLEVIKMLVTDFIVPTRSTVYKKLSWYDILNFFIHGNIYLNPNISWKNFDNIFTVVYYQKLNSGFQDCFVNSDAFSVMRKNKIFNLVETMDKQYVDLNINVRICLFLLYVSHRSPGLEEEFFPYAIDDIKYNDDSYFCINLHDFFIYKEDVVELCNVLIYIRNYCHYFLKLVTQCSYYSMSNQKDYYISLLLYYNNLIIPSIAYNIERGDDYFNDYFSVYNRISDIKNQAKFDKNSAWLLEEELTATKLGLQCSIIELKNIINNSKRYNLKEKNNNLNFSSNFKYFVFNKIFNLKRNLRVKYAYIRTSLIFLFV